MQSTDTCKFKETTVRSTEVFSGKIIRVTNDDILLPDGKPATREVVRHRGAVCVVPVTDEGEILIVKQYRYPFEKVLIEIPAGKLDSAEEDPLEAAKRELKEETGVITEKIEYMGKYYGSPAILDEVIHMYLATGIDFSEKALSQSLDEDEFVDVESIPVDELVEMIMSGEISDGKTQAAVLRAALRLNRLIRAENPKG